MTASVHTISEPLPPASHRASCCVAAARGVAAGVPILSPLALCQDTAHWRVQSPLATPSSELRSEGADNARIRPLGVAAVPSSMPSERGLNKPAASDLAAVPLLLTPAEAAQHYRVCLRTVRYWIARRRLRVHQPAGKGGKVLILNIQ